MRAACANFFVSSGIVCAQGDQKVTTKNGGLPRKCNGGILGIEKFYERRKKEIDIEGGMEFPRKPQHGELTLCKRYIFIKRYVNTALGLCVAMESCIKQNNAIEIYEVFFF